MTVIAWDGATLAADCMAVVGGGIKRKVSKIGYLSKGACGQIYAMTGNWDVAAEILGWLNAGGSEDKPEGFPASARDGNATVIVFAPPSVFAYQSGPYPLRLDGESPCAFGSGRDYAEAVMYLGGDAKEAVEVACHFQVDCGMGVEALTWSNDAQSFVRT